MRYYEIVHTESVAVIAAMNSNHYVGDLYVIVTEILFTMPSANVWVFTRGQFWPSGSVVACVSLSVTKFVRAITHCPFKLGQPNLDQRCQRPSLVEIPIVLWDDWSWPSRSNWTPKSNFTPFWACACQNSTPIEITISKFGTKMHLNTVQIPTNFRLDWNWSSIQFSISHPEQTERFMYIIGVL